jgi:hypothetical protein
VSSARHAPHPTACHHSSPALLPTTADRTLQRLKREYADPSSRSNSSRLQAELADIQTIMRKNIAEVLDRGEKLESACGAAAVGRARLKEAA